MGSLIGLAIGWLLKHFTFEVAKYVAFRAMIIVLMFTLGPIVLFKGWTMIVQYLMAYAGSYAEGQSLTGQMIQLVGIAAYLGEKIKIAEGVSIFLTFLGVSFVFRMLRVK